MPEGGPVERVQAFIADRGLRPGDRMPPERLLIGELDLTRTELRKALDALEREGVIWRHVGKGTFLSDAGPLPAAEVAGRSGAAPLPGRLADLAREVTPFQLMRARLTLEPSLAREAALHASGAALTRLRLAMERARAASTWAEYEAQDDAFHRAIAEATDNVLLIALFDQLNAVRRAVTFENVTRRTARPPANHSSFAEHEAIAAGIAARDPQTAHEAMRRHLKSVAARLFDTA